MLTHPALVLAPPSLARLPPRILPASPFPSGPALRCLAGHAPCSNVAHHVSLTPTRPFLRMYVRAYPCFRVCLCAVLSECGGSALSEPSTTHDAQRNSSSAYMHECVTRLLRELRSNRNHFTFTCVRIYSSGVAIARCHSSCIMTRFLE